MPLCRRFRLPACRFLFFLLLPSLVAATTLRVDPSAEPGGDGSPERPFASLWPARAAARTAVGAGGGPVTVLIAPGELRLSEPFVLSPEDSGTADAPVVYTAEPGAEVEISGAIELDPAWTRWRGRILQTRVPAGLAFDRLRVAGQWQIRARFPNFDPADPLRSGQGYLAVVDGSNRRPDTWLEYDPRTFSPREWAHPETGIVHAFQSVNWGNLQYRITGVDRARHRLLLGAGGWQMQREHGIGQGRGSSSPYYVENIFEELDSPGEWFLDTASNTLYWWPPAGVDPATAVVEGVVLKNLVEIRGTAAHPVRHVTLRGLRFAASGLTFMQHYEPVTRSDWAIHRGGAVFIEGAEDCRVEDCDFEDVGGNAVFLSDYNRRVAVVHCRFRHTGDSAVAIVGADAAVRNRQTWDALDIEGRPWISDRAAIDPRRGPATPDIPEDCVVENCDMAEIGVYGKQVAGVVISKSHRITVRHTTIHGTARAGICIADGTWGGHRIEDCDIWDTIRETGEHGPFNSWGRDRMWFREGELQKDLVRLDSLAPTVIHHNRIANGRRSISAGSWTIDLDDGSSLYEITDNLSLGSTLKLRDGFFRTVRNNIFISPVPLGLHVWPEKSEDVFEHNIVVVAGRRPGEESAESAMIRPILMHPTDWAQGFDRNLYWNANTGRFRVDNDDWAAWQARGFDVHSRFADPLFVDPAAGDFHVRPDSPAWELGFRNFPMDGFGHRMTRIEPRGGDLAGKVAVRLRADARGGEVRYTLDGTAPSPLSPRATGPLVITADTTLRARTFRDGVPVDFGATAVFRRVDNVTQAAWLTALLAGDAGWAANAAAYGGEIHYWLGAALRAVAGDQDLIDATGGQDYGLYVHALPGDVPAASEGLRSSDVVRECNGVRLVDWDDFQRALAQSAGDRATLVVRRNQRDLTLEVTLPGR